MHCCLFFILVIESLIHCNVHYNARLDIPGMGWMTIDLSFPYQQMVFRHIQIFRSPILRMPHQNNFTLSVWLSVPIITNHNILLFITACFSPLAQMTRQIFILSVTDCKYVNDPFLKLFRHWNVSIKKKCSSPLTQHMLKCHISINKQV